MPTIREKEVVLAQIFYLFILPVFLLYFNVIPGDYRFLMLFMVSILLFGIVHRSAWTYADVGFKKDWWVDWKEYLFFTIGCVLFMFWLSRVVPHEPFVDWYNNKKFLLLFAPISILQEIVFRGVLLKMLQSAFSNMYFIVFVNALVFALIHVIYVNAIFILPLTFMAGIAFVLIYLYKPNIVLISISHTILNFVAMILGFFVVR
jgi:membrane protease YdiL (CAAX protease family)